MTSTRPARPASRRRSTLLGTAVLSISLGLAGGGVSAAEDGYSVVVTTEVLGSVVGQVVGDAAEVTVIMPSGANPHSYEPSARDAERILGADVVVSNGLELEEALLSVLESAASEGVTWFQAAEHVSVRDLESAGDDGHEGDHDDEAEREVDHDDEAEHEHAHDDEDPHFWTDPLAMRDVVLALGPVLEEAGIVTGDGAVELADELAALDATVTQILAGVADEDRKLVTGHRSLGYFADRYGFALIGTVIPSLSTSGEPTARELAQLIEDIEANGVAAVFTEVGTPQSVAQAVADDSGVELVPLSTSQLPDGGSYQDLVIDIATTIAGALAA